MRKRKKKVFLFQETYTLKCRAEAEIVAEQISYPCLLKQTWRPEGWTSHTKVKAAKANSAKEFLSLYDHYQQWLDILLVQEWIECPEENHFTCNCYFDRNSEQLVTFTSRKLRQWLPKTDRFPREILLNRLNGEINIQFRYVNKAQLSDPLIR